jgi:hypothetical protein
LNHVEGQEVANPIYDRIGLGLIDLSGYLHADHTEGDLLGRNLTAEDYRPYLRGSGEVIEGMSISLLALA